MLGEEREIDIKMTVLEAVGCWRLVKQVLEAKTSTNIKERIGKLAEDIYELTAKDVMIMLSLMSKLAAPIDVEMRRRKDEQQSIAVAEGMLPSPKIPTDKPGGEHIHIGDGDKKSADTGDNT
jgi:hypothetical protein